MTRAAAVWLERPPAAWNELLRDDPNATPAHRPELWHALAGVRPGLAARFVAVRSGDTLLGGAAAIIERRGPFHWIHALPMGLPGAPLARAGRHEEVDRAVALALDQLRCELRALGGSWSLYRPRGPAVAPAALAGLPGETTRLESAVIDLGAGLAAAWRRIDRKARQEITRARAQLRAEEDPGSLETAYALYAAQSRGWAAHTSMPLELSRRLLARAGDAPPAARLFTVRDARGPLSAAFALDHAREVLVWWSGTHPEGRSRQAFGLLLWSIVEWAAAAGRVRVNLGANPGLDAVAAFKRSLGAEPLAWPIRWLDARAASLAGRALAGVQRWRGRARARGAPA
ncbi:MAG TPA: GNAT family N-acetyltransferase [Candidatus Eisenbacteria bacterium]